MNVSIRGTPSSSIAGTLPIKVIDDGTKLGIVAVTTVPNPSPAASYVPRAYKFSPVADDDQVVPMSTTDIYFEKGYFYGIQSADVAGAGYVVNADPAYLGEKDATGNIFCIDVVTNDPGYPVIVTAVPGTKLNLKDFYVHIGSAGDAVLCKYQ